MEEERIWWADRNHSRSGGVADGTEEDDGNKKSEIHVVTLSL